MPANYYFLHLQPSRVVSDERVLNKLNLARDWLRLDTSTLILYTTSSLTTWKTRLAPLVRKDGRYFICPIDPTKRAGWMNRAFWDWLRSHSEK